MRSLQSRLLLAAAVGTAAVFSISGVGLYGLIRASLTAEFDRALASKARELAGLAEQEGDKIDLELDEVAMPEYERAHRPEYYQVWLAGGRVLARSPSLRGADLPRVAGPVDAPACQAVRLPDGRPGRIAGLEFTPRQEHRKHRRRPKTAHRLVLVLARDTLDLDATLARMKLLLAGVSAAAIIIATGVLAWVVRRGLRPVNRLAGQIEHLDESDLSTRLEPTEVPTELLPIVNRLNELLARLEAAFAREKAFTGDVAHELRTPLSGLRSTLEVALSRSRPAEAYRQAIADGAVIARQMQTMVDNLLALARAEAGQLEMLREPVAVDALLRECWAALADRAQARGLRVAWQTNPCVLQTDREKLRLVLGNILDNAVTYADAGGQVWICTGLHDGNVELCIANTGSQLSPHQAEHVFERFWRGDAARSDAGVHCGLGLSLARKIVTLLGGSIAVESTAGGIFTIRLLFPADQDRNG